MIEAADPIPENSLHGVSMSLPLWHQVLDWVNMDPTLRGKAKSAYPRFLIHFKIEQLVSWILKNYGREGESAMIFPTAESANRARDFIHKRKPEVKVRLLQLTPPKKSGDIVCTRLSIVLFPSDVFPVAKEYWQHTGEGISSRQAVFSLERLGVNHEQDTAPEEADKKEEEEEEEFVEQRFGRNLDQGMADEAKQALRRRIAAEITLRWQNNTAVSPGDVFLYPTGMTAIFSAHRVILELADSDAKGLKSVCFGFPYADTLKVLQKWGPGAVFYPNGTSADLDEMEHNLDNGTLKISSLYCEVPTNPLLNTPDLLRIRKLADKFGFYVVVDDTVGNFYNVDTLSYADMTVASLTKLFSGDGDVMAGCLILNPVGKSYPQMKEVVNRQFTDALWYEDGLHLERNSRDFGARNSQVNATSEAVVDLMRQPEWSDLVDQVYYPKYSQTRANYDALKVKGGGYAGLFSVVFKQPRYAMEFYDHLNIAKGPSLGTNFTLGCPYTILAHYSELDFAESCGVDRNLVRISVGLEPAEEILAVHRNALEKVLELSKKSGDPNTNEI